MEARVHWVWPVPGDFLGTNLALIPTGVAFTFQSSRTGRTTLQAVDSTGVSRWSADWNGLNALRVEGEKIWLDGRTVRLVDARTGSLLAERRLEAGTDVVAAGVFFEGSYATGRYLELSEDLSTLWEWKESAPEFSLVSTDMLARVGECGLDLVSVPSLNRREIALTLPKVLGNTLMSGGVLVQLSMGPGSSLGVDTEAGRLLWSFDDPLGFGLAQKCGRAAISSGSRLRAVELATGELMWEREMAAPIVNFVRIVSNRGYFATMDGRINIVDCNTGQALYEKRLPFRPTGLGFEPSPVLPLGDSALVIGTRENIYCVGLD